MVLTSGETQTEFEFHVVGYQFADVLEEEYDANWLMVRICVKSGESEWTKTIVFADLGGALAGELAGGFGGGDRAADGDEFLGIECGVSVDWARWDAGAVVGWV